MRRVRAGRRRGILARIGAWNLRRGAEPVRVIFLSWLVVVSALAAGCGTDRIQRRDGVSTAQPFILSNLAKSEADMVTELTQREVLRGLRRLTEKLYRRNPQEYRKAGLDRPETAAARLFEPLQDWRHATMARARWQYQFSVAFDPAYQGDRVEAYMSALLIMVMSAYNNQTEFFITDELDAQRFYNSARNMEIAAWKLAQARYPDGTPLLIASSWDEDGRNLSYERLFGKLIAEQDLLALILEDRNNRVIVRLLQSTASSIFLPI
jgi:hypothetical protein